MVPLPRRYRYDLSPGVLVDGDLLVVNDTKVFAALIIMAAFFSTIMTVLFKVRDRVLVWQKGTIKW